MKSAPSLANNIADNKLILLLFVCGECILQDSGADRES